MDTPSDPGADPPPRADDPRREPDDDELRPPGRGPVGGPDPGRAREPTRDAGRETDRATEGESDRDTGRDTDRPDGSQQTEGPSGGEERRGPRERALAAARGCLRPGCLLPALVVVLVLGLLAWWEMRTATLEAWLFHRMARGATYELVEGPAERVRYPSDGPYDVRLGYAQLPERVERLVEGPWAIESQAEVSQDFADLVDDGFYPLYREKPAAGLRIEDRGGTVFHDSPFPARAYQSFEEIPELLWRSLLYIENRDFLDESRRRANPAVEWDRLALSVGELGLRALGSDRNVPGGSTLATQIEKFRHSPEGRTSSAGEKLRQMLTASLRAYQEGHRTLEHRRWVLRAYINSVPLAAQRGHGEVTGTAEGLWAWYGTDFDEANRLLRGDSLREGDDVERARVFRQALSLLIAHRRPSYYLAQEAGRAELAELLDGHIRLLVSAGVVPEAMGRTALDLRVSPLRRAPERPPKPFLPGKAASQVRTHLLGLLGLPSLYELDRTDLTVVSTLDMAWQQAVSETLLSLRDPAWVRANGFGASRLLDQGDPSRVLYTFTLLEATPTGNQVRVQADNFEGPLSLTESGRIELGSTAKLRTLLTYLEVIEELHRRLSGVSADSLRRMEVPPRDRLTRWAADWLRANPGAELRPMLEASMERGYSASPGERFPTGGGVQTFANFDNTWDGQVLPVRIALRHSVNLPFIRMMRDLVHYYMYRGDASIARIFEDPSDPARQEYLERFADREGSGFVRQFHRKYDGLAGPAILDQLVRERRLGPQRMAWAYRSVAPDASLDDFRAFVQAHDSSGLQPGAVDAVFQRADPTPHPLGDLGYLARIHPLELWVARHLLENPGATLRETLDASVGERQEVYSWLFRSRSRSAQDQRIRSLLEIEAFQPILRSWQRVGYPYENIVPSYGTSIGSSGDRPLALAELMGVLVNSGVRRPVVRVESVRFAEDTPFDARVVREPAPGERVLSSDVAAVARTALLDVVANGTARRASGAFGEGLAIGGKTGTGDNRYRVFGRGGQVVATRVVNRTSTLAFFAGDRYFGVVTAYVQGPEAGSYRFTSALPSQILRAVGPRLEGLAAASGAGAPAASRGR